MVTALAIQRGDTLTLDCDFEVGLLDSHYDFTWFRINSISGFREQLLNGADRFRVSTCIIAIFSHKLIAAYLMINVLRYSGATGVYEWSDQLP